MADGLCARAMMGAEFASVRVQWPELFSEWVETICSRPIVTR